MFMSVYLSIYVWKREREVRKERTREQRDRDTHTPRETYIQVDLTTAKMKRQSIVIYHFGSVLCEYDLMVDFYVNCYGKSTFFLLR